MSVNKMDSDLLYVRLSWRRLSWYQRKRLFLMAFFEIQKKRTAAAVSALRATLCRLQARVIVPAAGGLSWPQLYALTTKQEKEEILLDILRTIEKRRRREYLRAVIVSACVRAWVISSAVTVPTACACGDLVPAAYCLFMLTCAAGR